MLLLPGRGVSQGTRTSCLWTQHRTGPLMKRPRTPFKVGKKILKWLCQEVPRQTPGTQKPTNGLKEHATHKILPHTSTTGLEAGTGGMLFAKTEKKPYFHQSLKPGSRHQLCVHLPLPFPLLSLQHDFMNALLAQTTISFQGNGHQVCLKGGPWPPVQGLCNTVRDLRG